MEKKNTKKKRKGAVNDEKNDLGASSEGKTDDH